MFLMVASLFFKLEQLSTCHFTWLIHTKYVKMRLLEVMQPSYCYISLFIIRVESYSTFFLPIAPLSIPFWGSSGRTLMTQREQVRLNGRISIIIFNVDSYKKTKILFFSMLEQEVTLPVGFTCEQCVLQLLRQAAEWTAAGGYTFWSCADIAIVDSPG